MIYIGLGQSLLLTLYFWQKRHHELIARKGKLIERHLLETRCYLDSEFQFSDLEHVSGLSSQANSQIINRYFDQSFGELITKMRVEQVQKVLQSKQGRQWPLLRLAMECGFNSKSSFNSAFKRYTGTTPSEYKKSIQTT